ncbi:MAG TPA: Gfo/Idh/MocA family oxidoreductase [Polyangiaceae bacterium]
MRIGVIGATGHQGKRYLSKWNIPDGMECFAVPRGEPARHCEALIVATPVGTHRAIVESALMCGYHVLCEKPAALTLEDARAMFDLAKSQERVLLIAHTHLWHPDFLRLQPSPHATVIWRGEERTDCPAVLDWGSHAWSMALHLGTERVATGLASREGNTVRSGGASYPDDYSCQASPMRDMLETFRCLVAGGQDWRADPEFALEVMRRCLA